MLAVAPADIAGDVKLTAAPLLAVEIRSPSDFQLLERAGRPRIEAKRDDYASNRLRHYLEVVLTPEREVRLDRYELHEARLTLVASATAGATVLEADEPFAYSVVPEALLRF